MDGAPTTLLAAADTAWLIGTAAFTALAALAACAAVFQTRRLQRAQLLPHLHFGGAKRDESGAVTFIIANLGGGSAKWVKVLYVQGAEKVDTFAGEAFLLPGEQYTVSVPFQGPAATPQAVLIARDLDEVQHAWSLEGRHHATRRTRRFGRRWYHRLWAPELYPDLEDEFSRFYPDTMLSPLRAVTATSIVKSH